MIRNWNSPQNIVRLIVVILLVQLSIGSEVWLSDTREFPFAPFFTDLVFRFPTVVAKLLFVGMCLSLVTLLFNPFQKRAAAVFLGAATLLILEDVTRLQPWLYLFSLMLATVLFLPKTNGKKPIYLSVQIVLSAIYFYSGMLKLNPSFTIEIFPWLMEFAGLTAFFDAHPHWGYLAGIFEMLAGIGWWIPGFRKYAWLLAIGMHSFILLSIGPFGHDWNHIVWPWNIGFALLYTMAYFKNPVWEKPKLELRYAKVLVVMVAVMPMTNLIGVWDHFLSGSFYSSRLPEAIFYYEESDWENLPASSEEYQYIQTATDQHFVLLDYWALGTMNVPIYPQNRSFKTVGKKLCDCVKDEENAGIEITKKLPFTLEETVERITCKELK